MSNEEIILIEPPELDREEIETIVGTKINDLF